MKRNLEKTLEFAEKHGLNSLFQTSDSMGIISRNNRALYDSVYEALCFGAAVGYKQALKDIKKKGARANNEN